MSLEQARGQELDHRTDIFSLGVVLYNMVAGETPFHGPHPAAILEKLLHAPTPSLRTSYPDIPDALEQTIARATAKDPEDRYQSMQEFASDLRSVSGLDQQAAIFAGATGIAKAALAPRQKKRRRTRLHFVFAAAALDVLALLAALLFRERLPVWMGGSAASKVCRKPKRSLTRVLPPIVLTDSAFLARIRRHCCEFGLSQNFSCVCPYSEFQRPGMDTFRLRLRDHAHLSS